MASPNPSPEVIAERKRVCREMRERGKRPCEIAAALGITERSVHRYLEKLGMTQPQVYPWSEEELRLARSLLEDECPYAEVARTLGVNVGIVQNRFPGMGRIGSPLGNGWHMRLAEALDLGMNYRVLQ